MYFGNIICFGTPVLKLKKTPDVKHHRATNINIITLVKGNRELNISVQQQHV